MSATASSSVTQAAVKNTASGLIFETIFGTAWAFGAANALNGWESPWPILITAAIAIFLISRGIRLRRASTKFPADDRTQQDQRRTSRFRFVFVLELVFIALGVVICNATGHPELGIPIAVLIVGLHFLPLAPLFRVRAFYVTGVLMCLLVALTIALVPSKSTFQGVEIHAWWAIAGFGAAVILWGTALYSWFRGRELLDQAQVA